MLFAQGGGMQVRLTHPISLRSGTPFQACHAAGFAPFQSVPPPRDGLSGVPPCVALVCGLCGAVRLG